MIPPDLKETDRVKMKVVLKINASHGGRTFKNVLGIGILKDQTEDQTEEEQTIKKKKGNS